MQNTWHYTEALYVQATKASSSNRIIVEGAELQQFGIEEYWIGYCKRKMSNQDLAVNDEPDIKMASRRLLGENVGGCWNDTLDDW